MENWRERRSSEKKQLALFVAVFLRAATPWCVDTCQDSLMSDSSNIVAEAKGLERE